MFFVVVGGRFDDYCDVVDFVELFLFVMLVCFGWYLMFVDCVYV